MMDVGILYVLSGTGNTLRVAQWLGESLSPAPTIVRTEHSPNAQELRGSGPPALLGLLTPTHGFTAPWHMIKFACRLPRHPGTPAVVMATRAGLRFGRLFVPGIGGSCTLLLSLILLLKGYRVRAIASVDMPSNWYSLHPIQGLVSQRLILKRSKTRVLQTSLRLRDNRRLLWTRNNLWELVWGVSLSWLSCAYLCVGRFFLAKLFFANRNCDGCGVCAKGCPDQAIAMLGRTVPRPFWRYNCESCMRCAALCPHNGVEAGHLWAMVLFTITGLPMVHMLLTYLGDELPWAVPLRDHPIRLLLDLLYFFPALFISYGLFYLALRVRTLNSLFTATTLTHYWRRYREPDTRPKTLLRRPRASSDRT